jgi:hypothetical protein
LASKTTSRSELSLNSVNDGVEADTYYRFRVSAVNNVGTGQVSNFVSAKTDRKHTTPFAPINLQESGKSQRSITVSFDPPNMTGGSAIQYYKIYVQQYD